MFQKTLVLLLANKNSIIVYRDYDPLSLIYEEGEQQGALESMTLFNLGVDIVNDLTNNKICIHEGELITGAENTYIITPPPKSSPYLHKHKV